MTVPTDVVTGDPRALLPVPGGQGVSLRRLPLPPAPRPDAALGVLDITKYFGATTGGIRTYLLEKASYVTRHPALRQALVLPGARDAITDIDGVRAYWVRGPAIPFQHPYRFLVSRRAVERILEHERPDLIEVGSPFLVPWLTRRANRRLGAPMVWFYHGNVPRVIAPHPVRTSLARRGLANAAWRYIRRTSRIFRSVIACSEFTARDLEAHGIEHVARMPLGVDLELFDPSRRARRPEIRHREGWPDGPVVLHLGRLAGEKELDVALRAWPEIERRTGATLVIAGTGPSERRLRRLARGSVLWRPFASDRARVADLMAAADIYLAPCPVETFGLAALEALASGTPVLTAGQGGVAELVTASGAGALYAPGDPADCAGRATELLTADLRSLGRRGRDHAETHHAWPAVFDRLFAFYRTVVAR